MKHITRLNKKISSLLLAIQLISLVLLPGIAHALSTGSIQSWNSTTVMPSDLHSASSVVYNGYVYEIGGIEGNSSAVNTVYYAPLNADGTVGTWNTTTALPNVLYGATSVATNGYVYEIGGDNFSGVVNTVYYAPLNSNGTVGNWQSTSSLPIALFYATSVTYNGYVYEIGGIEGNSSAVNTVYYAPLNANGTVGNWTSTTVLPSGLENSTSVVYNGYVYEIGGIEGNSSAVNTVYYAPLNSNGTVGNWTATTVLPNALYNATSVATNGYVYEIGGIGNTTGTTNTVYYAPLNSNGTIGTWNTTTALPDTIYYATSVVYNGYVYEIGGVGNTGTVNTVYYAGLTPSPSNNTNTQTSSSSPTTSSPNTPDTGFGEPTHISPIVTLISISSIVSISLGLTLIYKKTY